MQLGHSHSQAITQGTDKSLKLYFWFSFTEKSRDISPEDAIKNITAGIYPEVDTKYIHILKTRIQPLTALQRCYKR